MTYYSCAITRLLARNKNLSECGPGHHPGPMRYAAATLFQLFSSCMGRKMRFTQRIWSQLLPYSKIGDADKYFCCSALIPMTVEQLRICYLEAGRGQPNAVKSEPEYPYDAKVARGHDTQILELEYPRFYHSFRPRYLYVRICAAASLPQLVAPMVFTVSTLTVTIRSGSSFRFVHWQVLHSPFGFSLAGHSAWTSTPLIRNCPR
jgi:hypothetical protein